MKLFSGAPFRISSTLDRKSTKRENEPAEGPPMGGAAPATEAASLKEEQAQKPLEKIIKLIPGEVILLYTSFRSKALESYHGTPEQDPEPVWFFVFQSMCLAVLVVIRWAGSKDSDKPDQKPQIGGVLISCVSFILWIFALGDPVFGICPDFAPDYILQASALAWAIVVPILYKGDSDESN